MNILTQFHEILTKSLYKNFNNYLYNLTVNLNNINNINNYKQFMDDFDTFTSNLNKDSYCAFIMTLDNEFMNSSIRKSLYDSKGFVNKDILTPFGWIHLKRRRYVSKETGESYMYVDRFLGLQKYSRLDPFVISELCEEASSNSYAKAGRNVSKLIGNKIKYNNDPNKFLISRATCRNNVIKASKIIEIPLNDDYKEVEVLNVMLDEKFVGSQFNDKKDHMIKSAVIFEGTTLEYKNRTRLTGKYVFGSIDDDLLHIVMDYIHYNYDTDKLKRINFMGDGAIWLKSFALDSSFKYHKDIIIKFMLDHFHLAQAIQHIVTNKHKETFSKILTHYIIKNMKNDFITVCDSIITLEKDREETIKEKMNYILNNWEYIQFSYHDTKYKCSMESNISHVFADIFTSRPKSYSKKGLRALLKIRLLKINGYDLKKLYFEALTNQEKTIKKRMTNYQSKQSKYADYFYQPFVIPKLSKSLNNI